MLDVLVGKVGSSVGKSVTIVGLVDVIEFGSVVEESLVLFGNISES